METATVTSSEPATASKTIADLLPLAVERFGPEPAVRYKDASGTWTSKTFAEVGDTVRQLALGLMELGIQNRRWAQVPFPYQTNATQVAVTLPLAAGNKFYRLRKP